MDDRAYDDEHDGSVLRAGTIRYLPCDACGVTRPVGVVLDGGVYTLCVECLAESACRRACPEQPTGDDAAKSENLAAEQPTEAG